jgi:hypothetical protein
LKRILIFGLFIIQFVNCRSQSPITNTPFYTAYSDFKIISSAEASGYLDQEIADNLMSVKISTDVKAAIINALSFEILGKDNAERFKKILLDKYNADSYNKIDTLLTADELFCLGYLTVMDDYFSPERGIIYFEKALVKNPTSYTINMIYNLTIAQEVFLLDKCKAWTLIDNVQKRTDLRELMLPDAINVIVDFMTVYKYDCD